MAARQEHIFFWDVVTALSILVALGATVYSLTRGITDVYPFLYFLPIILFVCFHPKYGVGFSLLLGTAYIFLVYYFGFADATLVAISTGWFVILVTVGVVTSSFANGLQVEEEKYRKLFEYSSAGIFTFDLATQTIQEVNERCARMLRFERSGLVGRELSFILLGTDAREDFIAGIRSGSAMWAGDLIFHSRDGNDRQFEVTATIVPDNSVICSVIDVTERKQAEDVIQKAKDDLEQRVRERTEILNRENAQLREEIEERKRFEEAIQLANRKLNTLSSITRHDILNQITALTMYLNLAEEKTENAIIRGYLNRIDEITQLIQKQIRFTRDYQTIGTLAPQWQNVRQTIGSAIADLQIGAVAIESDVDDLEIFADMLLGKVFFNLIDNALRHGEKVTKVRFLCRKSEDGLVLVCEDDGVGIPEHAKEKIFRQEYYRNTGYGLFLVAEILGITGISIRENGVPGTGARFEIFIPQGSYRTLSQKKGD